MQHDARAGDRDERARMQHLGAVVRDLRRFAMVQLRNQPRVRHEPRIRGQDAAHVLPQHDLARAQRPGQQRRRQIRSAAAERRRAAVRRLADEAGHDRRGAGGEQRAQRAPGAPAGLRQVGRGAAVLAVGRDDLAGVDVLRRAGRSSTAPPRAGRPTCARRGTPGCRSRAAGGGRARRPRRTARGTRAPTRRSSACSVRRAGPAGSSSRAISRCRRRSAAATRVASAALPAAACAAPSSSRSVTPASADATTTSGPGCRAMRPAAR